MKVCPRCETEKPATEFYKDRTKSGGLMSHCKICVDTRRRQWALHNKERLQERLRIYYRQAKADNPEKVRQKAREAQARFKEKRPERAKRASLDWRKNNPQLSRDSSRHWRENNPEKHALKNNRRRALKAGSGGNVTPQEWQSLLNYYGNICLCCGVSGQDTLLTQDHIKPLSKGGAHSIENLQPLCGSCNTSKGVKTIDYR